MSEKTGNATRASNIPALERASDKSWEEWLRIFEDAGAAKLSHSGIAELAAIHMPSSLDNPLWWAQAAAIAFEQHAGLRVPGQRADGTFSVSVSRTVPFDRATALAAWATQFGGSTHYLGHQVSKRRDSETPKRSFHRFNLDGAGKVEIAASPKSDTKTGLTISHEGLPSGERAQEWREFWRTQLAAL